MINQRESGGFSLGKPVQSVSEWPDDGSFEIPVVTTNNFPDQAQQSSAPLYTYRGGPEWGGLEPDPGTTALVARCIVAAEKLLGDAYTRQQTVTLAIDVWGALRRMFYGREAENIQAIADADLELLTRFVFNTKRALNPPGK